MRVTKRALLRAATAVALGALCTQAPAITVTVNENTTYQTMEGIGATEMAEGAASSPWRYRSGPFYVTVNLDSIHYFDTMIVDGGFTALRCDPIDEFQATQGDYSVTATLRTELQNEARFLRVARQHGESFRLLWHCSPPAWMKANNSCCAVGNDPNNYLLPSHYTDFANDWIRLLQIARDTFGVEVYAVSLQNEPLFNEPYPSCNYGIGPGCGWNGVCYNSMFRVVAPLIHAAFPDVKLVASEDLNRTVIETNLRADAISNPLIYAWATHNDYVSSFAYWPDRPVWNTEPHPTSFMDDAQMCMSNIAAGASAWFDFGFTNGNCSTSGTNSTACMKTGTYTSLKMYARYVRPGAKMIQSSGGVSGNYGVIAFYHPTNICLTIILINSTAIAQPATLSVTGTYQPAQLNAFYSDSTHDEISAGTVAANGTYSMPPNSISTLVAGTYLGTPLAVSSPAPPARGVSQAVRPGAVRLYALDGRLAATSRVAGVLRLAPGVYCTQAARGAGAARSLQVRGLAP